MTIAVEELVETTVAMAGLLLLHVPPGGVAVKVTVVPTQMAEVAGVTVGPGTFMYAVA